MSLARGAARGAVWNFATVLFERGFGFLILALLLRYIPASSVGVVAIGSAISDLVRMIAVGGAGEQVQAAPGDAEVEAGAFWSQFLASLLLGALLVAAAPSVAGLYHDPLLALVLQILAVNVVITSFLVVPAAKLMAAFRFRAAGLISLGSTIAGGLVALPLAIAGRGVDALVYQRLVGVLFYAGIACWAAGWLPPRPPRLAVLRSSLRFSWPLMQASVVDFVSITAYVMVVGLRMSAADVGRFRIAQRLVEVLQEIAFAPARKVFLPVFVAVREDPARLFEATVTMLDLLAVIIFFCAAVSGAAARPIVLLMFGDRWAAAVPVFAIMTLMAPVTALYGVINPLLTAAGRTGLVSWFAWANVAIILVASWFAAPYGLTVLAWALAARGLLTIFLFIPAMRIGLGRPVAPLLRLLVVPLTALLAARLAAWGVEWLLPDIGLGQDLCFTVAASALTFAAVMLAFAPRRVMALERRLRHALVGREMVENGFL
jgi:O-antigen/teichoic acid export membrane protein